MSLRDNVKLHFKELEKRASELASEPLKPKDSTTSPSSIQTLSSINNPPPKPLLVMLDNTHNEEHIPSITKKTEILALLEAPLVVLGTAPLNYLEHAASSGQLWTKWWIDQAKSNSEKTRELIKSRYIGSWFVHSVVETLAKTILKHFEFSESNSRSEGRLVTAYLQTGWTTLALLVCALSQRSSPSLSAESLTLATRLLDYAAVNGLFGPRYQVMHIQHENGGTVAWAEYVKIASTVPERIANAVDAEYIPDSLVAHTYFPNIAEDAVECIPESTESDDYKRIIGFISKLCRVGQTECLSAAFAAGLVRAADNQDTKTLIKLSSAIDTVPVPFNSRIVYTVFAQLDRMLRGKSSRILRYRVTLVVSYILAQSLSASDAGSISVPPEWSAAMMQCIALAIQAFSGVHGTSSDGDSEYSELSELLPKPIDKSLLAGLVERKIIPEWAGLMAYSDRTTAMTRFVMMCLGSLSALDLHRISMSSAFASAIPRFLDAGDPEIRILGVIVADYVVNAKAKPDDKIDFGIDDVFRNANNPALPQNTQNAYAQNAHCVKEMRSFARPVIVQWTDNNTAPSSELGRSMDPGSVSDAIEYIRAYSGADSEAVLEPRKSSLSEPQRKLQNDYVKPRRPVFLHDCLSYIKDKQNDSARVQIGLFAITESINRSQIKSLEELWIRVASCLCHLQNVGPESLDWAWDLERRKALAALAVRIPEAVGPYLADRSCDRNLTLKDKEIVLSAIATACLELSGIERSDTNSTTGKSPKPMITELDTNTIDGSSDNTLSGTVVRRSRKLDIAQTERTEDSIGPERRYASIVGPAFFFPLSAQYAKSEVAGGTSDVRENVGMFARYLNTLATILYSARTAVHLLRINREFWDLTKAVRKLPVKVSEASVVLDALLFGIDAILDPDRALSIPTLAREFRADIADTLYWLNGLAEKGVLGPEAMAHASRIVNRLGQIQNDVRERLMSKDFNKYTSII